MASKLLTALVRVGAIITCTALSVGCASAEPAPESASATAGAKSPTLADVVDGDTVVIEFSTGERETVRLLGIDTPETVDPNRPEQCFGKQASATLADLLPEGTEVRLERDVEARDHYGRLLAYIYRAEDGLFVNVELVTRGLADVSLYEPNTTYRRELETAVTTARTQSRGLWGVCGGPDVPVDPTG